MQVFTKRPSLSVIVVRRDLVRVCVGGVGVDSGVGVDAAISGVRGRQPCP